jgi:cation transporter-like permease
MTEEERFLKYWSENRERERTSLKPLLVGLSAGFAIGIGVLVLLETGWFERAQMVANSRLSSLVLVVAFMCIALFMAFVYRRFRWEMKEQTYQEGLARQKNTGKYPNMQP